MNKVHNYNKHVQSCMEKRNLDTSLIDAYLREFRKTNHHQNADALNRLPSGKDPTFDEEEKEEEDVSNVVRAIETLSQQIESTNSSLVKKETSKDLVLTKLMRFTREDWPSTLPSNDPAQQF